MSGTVGRTMSVKELSLPRYGLVGVAILAIGLFQPAWLAAQRAPSGRTSTSPRRNTGTATGQNGSAATSRSGRPTRTGLPPMPSTERRYGPATWWWFSYAGFPVLFDSINGTAAASTPAVPSAPPIPPPPPEPSVIQPLPSVAPPVTSPRADHGRLHIDIEPGGAQIYVDGFFLGTTDYLTHDIELSAGWHRVEFRAPGFESAAVNVTIETNQTFSYRGSLKAIVR